MNEADASKLLDLIWDFSPSILPFPMPIVADVSDWIETIGPIRRE
jgi:hypothetical protein